MSGEGFGDYKVWGFRGWVWGLGWGVDNRMRVRGLHMGVTILGLRGFVWSVE